ncbi:MULTISPECIES: hypothetical protein [unclassified Streptomyces]|uniref:hypothetical protein n=1 Tax=unclassified Streptomyces TaxID=2593676 RepID=UPI00380FD7F5
MRKLHKAAVVAAVLGSVSFLGAGTANAGGAGGCGAHVLDVNVLGEVGIANGILSNLINSEGSPGGQITGMGSSMGCNGHGW